MKLKIFSGMSNEDMTWWTINLLGWNYQSWVICPKGHKGCYLMRIDLGDPPKITYRCKKCGLFTIDPENSCRIDSGKNSPDLPG